jgi:hypothetical protein
MPHISYHILFNFILSLYILQYFFTITSVFLVVFDEMPWSLTFTFNWRNGSYRTTVRSSGLTFTAYNSKYNSWIEFLRSNCGKKRQHMFWLNVSRVILQDDTYYEAKNVQNKGLSDATSLTNVRNYIQIETWEWTSKVTKRGKSCLCRRGLTISLVYLSLWVKKAGVEQGSHSKLYCVKN